MKIPEIKISVKYDKAKQSELYKISCSKDIYELAKKVFNADTIQWTEEQILFCLNRANNVVGFYKVSSGGTTATLCDTKVILTIALNCCAQSIILVHNHPSGNLKPSEGDITVSKKVKEAANLLDITLLDHIIISEEGYFSCADTGII
jgi:DNA repair protein RadC